MQPICFAFIWLLAHASGFFSDKQLLGRLGGCKHMCKPVQVMTDLTNYAELYRGLQAASLPLKDDRSGLIYNPLAVIEVMDTRHISFSCK